MAPFFYTCVKNPNMDSFEWRRIFLGEDHPPHFLFEVLFRTLVMYGIMLVFFKVTGKKGIKQLSVFDLILIIGLGSAAGDPMFYDDVPLLHALVVFATILGLYLGINRLTQKSHKLDEFLEGKTSKLFDNGRIDMEKLKRDGLTTMQFFSELRQHSIAHLGQLRKVYLEFSGETSPYFCEDDAVQPGLPIYPELLEQASVSISQPGHHSCVQCGYTKHYPEAVQAPLCPYCGCVKFVASIDERRVA